MKTSALLRPLAALALAIALPAAARPIPTLTVDQVEQRLRAPGVVILDVNVPEVFEDHHLPGARHVERDLAAVLPPDRKATLIFYCYDPRCSASRDAAAEAIGLGYVNVYLMPEGIVGWLEAKKPFEAE
jgi:rhodanese-related sulfurtransferase